MPQGNGPTTQLHVKLARLDPASIATLLMAMLLLQSLFTRTTSRCHQAHCRILCSKFSLLIGLTFLAIISTWTVTFIYRLISICTMMFMPTIFKLVFQHTDLEGTSITDLEGIGSVRLGGLLTWRAPTLEDSLGA